MLTKEKEEKVIALCRELIRSRSYSGEEKETADKLQDFFEKSGFDEIHRDKYGNIIGLIHGKREGATLLYDGHMDTVPVGSREDWSVDPFGAEYRDGKIYGRGAADMKGALAAMAAAASFFAEETGKDFAGTIAVAGVVHEECFEGVAAREISAYVKPDYVVIGEASNLNLKIGQRGRAEIKLETFGKPAHSANPEKGLNAVYEMFSLGEEVRKLPVTEHAVLGKGILELTDIKSSPYPGASVVPQYCVSTYDRRLLTGETKESVLKPLQELITAWKEKSPGWDARVSFAVGKEKCYTGEVIEGERFFPGWLFEEEAPFVRQVMEELDKTGMKTEITQYNFCTNGSHYAGEKGICTMGMGPGDESIAHTIDEYVETQQLLGVAEKYMAISRALLR